RLGRQAKECQLRPRPVDGKGRRLARIGQCDRAGDFAIEQRWTKYLRRERDVLGADVERRAIAVEGGGRFVATDKDAERKTADCLRSTGVNAAERRLPIDPAGQGPARD